MPIPKRITLHEKHSFYGFKAGEETLALQEEIVGLGPSVWEKSIPDLWQPNRYGFKRHNFSSRYQAENWMIEQLESLQKYCAEAPHWRRLTVEWDRGR